MATTFYSPTNGANGRITADNATFATAHNATSGTFDSTLGKLGCGLDTTYKIDRLFFGFNTSAIPANATVVSATLNVYGSATYNPAAFNNGTASDVDCVQGTPADPTTLVDGDYDQLGTTVASSIAMASIDQDGLNTWAVTPAWVVKGGKTCICLRHSLDIDNTTPSQLNRCYFDLLQDANDPYLVVTYTVPSSGFFAIL